MTIYSVHFQTEQNRNSNPLKRFRLNPPENFQSSLPSNQYGIRLVLHHPERVPFLEEKTRTSEQWNLYYNPTRVSIFLVPRNGLPKNKKRERINFGTLTIHSTEIEKNLGSGKYRLNLPEIIEAAKPGIKIALQKYLSKEDPQITGYHVMDNAVIDTL